MRKKERKRKRHGKTGQQTYRQPKGHTKATDVQRQIGQRALERRVEGFLKRVRNSKAGFLLLTGNECFHRKKDERESVDEFNLLSN